MFVADDDLEIAISNFLISSHDYSNHEIEHDDLKEVGLCEEDGPDQIDINVNKNIRLYFWITTLFEDSIVCWQSQLPNSISKCFKQNLTEIIQY